MALVFRIGTDILDVENEQPFAVTDSRPSFLDLGSRKYEIVKGLKFSRTSNNRRIFGFADSVGVSPVTLRSIIDVEMVIDGLIRITGNLKITDNDNKYYNGTFTSRNSIIETLSAYYLDDAINLHTFDLTTWNTLTPQQRLNYITQNTDPAWVLPFIGSSAHPYNNSVSGNNNIVPYSGPSIVVQDLWYNLGIAINEIITDASLSISVLESGSEVAFSSSDLYNDVISNLFTPTFYWMCPSAVPTASGNIQYPTSTMRRYEYKSSAGYLTEAKIIKRDNMSNMGGLNIWEMLVLLSKYLGFVVEVRESSLLIIPFSEILTNDIIDLSDKLINEISKQYFVDGYEKTNYIRFDVNNDVIKTLGEMSFTQNVDYLKEEEEVYKLPIVLPGIYDLGAVSNFFRVTWDNKYSSAPIVLFLDNTDTVSGTAEYEQGADLAGGIVFSATFYKLNLYSPSTEFSILQDILDEAIVYEAEFDLNIIDKYNLKPYTRVTVSQLGGTFIVEPFEWVKGKSTKLKLLKIA